MNDIEKRKQFGESNLAKWDTIHNLVKLIKDDKAVIVSKNGKKFVALKNQ